MKSTILTYNNNSIANKESIIFVLYTPTHQHTPQTDSAKKEKKLINNSVLVNCQH